MENELPVDLSKVLENCINGRFTEELKVLYKSPYRDCVPWYKFPTWMYECAVGISSIV